MNLKDSSDQLLEILSERLIKPSSSTPSKLRCHKLSQIDQWLPSIYVPRAFFYPVDGEDNRSSSAADRISQVLQTSLSKTLTYYYPFGGRLVNNCFVDCNDAGVQFTEARIKCSMSQFLKTENSHLRDLVFPQSIFSTINPTETSPFLLLQASFFDCGGTALAVCLNHKVSDASTTSNFLNDWAAMARGLDDGRHVPYPSFNGASLFPPDLDDDSCKNDRLKTSPPHENCITRRLLFPPSKIDELKAMAAYASGIENPTRYEVVTALLFRSAVAATTKANSGSFKPSTLLNVVNLRPLTVPPLPTNSAGNFLTFFLVSATEESHLELPELVGRFRKEKLMLHKHNKTSADSNHQRAEDASVSFDPCYLCSSNLRFPFHLVDFGFGKPALICEANQTGAKNTFRLTGTGDGDAIEATVTLDASEMAFFQGNDELLAFATLLN